MVVALVAMTAWADQCAWISKANAEAAVERLTPGSEWLAYCEPCGDKKPVLGHVGRATAGPADDHHFFQVDVDGAEVDLAYTYVHAPGDKAFTNLATLVGCPASSVTRRIPWPMPGVPVDRLAPWIGVYERPLVHLTITQYFDDPNGLAIQIDTPTEHPSMAATVQLQSYVNVDNPQTSFATALGSCRVRILKAQGGVELRPDAACGGLLAGIAGVYARVGG